MGWHISQARILAATNATNEAILRTQAEDELLQRVCDAAVHEGGVKTAAALLPDAESWLRVAAISGHDGREPLASVQISIDPNTPFGNGLAGTAFRSGRSCVTNDFQNDERLGPWRSQGTGNGVGALAAVPILRDGKSVGVFLFLLEEANSLDDAAIGLLERMVENVSFALKNFERARESKAAARANRRVTDMFAALSATNTAILRAKSAQEMFRSVCESVATGGKTLGACAVLLAQPGTDILKVVAAAGEGKEALEKLQLSIDPNHPNGQGLAGPAFRDQELKVSYDLLADNRTKALASQPRQSPYAGAAVPLMIEGRSVGILYFFFGRTTGTRDEGLLQLMRDIADNVSFGLQMFEREEQKQRISRMYAALSATNEAIMRAKSREDLYHMVTEAAGTGGRFTSTSIFLADDDAEFFTLAAVAGPRAHILRSRKYSPREDRAEGRGLTGTAYRTGKPCISNDVRANEKLVHWPYDNSMQGASRSGAALPLFSRGKTCGVLLFMGEENDTFTSDFVELLERLAENVSFALESFELADEKRLAEEQIQHLATHDGLTGLPNRALFNRLLEQSMKSASRHEQKCAVLFVDLDRFKVINDSLGHAAGDTLLVEVASRLRSSIRASDVVARLGGDEFVVLLNDVADVEQIALVARKLLTSLAPSLNVAGHECRTTASIGIAVFPDHGADPSTLTKHADMAMYLAKQEGKNDFRFFSTDIKSQSIERLVLETSLRNAIECNQFQLHYQPKIDAATDEITGVEALLRWTHPELGSLAPMKFIPLAEETGLIIPIGRWVLRTACTQAMAWSREGFVPITMAVNLSPRQFLDDGLLSDLDEILKETGMPAHLLQLEITESMVMQNVERAIKLLDAIQQRGVRLAIDDFGTGYSSMSMMKQLPIDTIKIDRSFVRDINSNVEDRAIATAIISMAKVLGLTVVAEGVETSEQDAVLRQSRCDELQGFLLGKPMPADKMPALLRRRIESPALQPASDTSGSNHRKPLVA